MSQLQPVDVYPNPVIREPNPSHTNGSFGPVFIVLAIIAVLSAVACVLGRLLSRRHHRVKAAHHHHPTAAHKQSNGGIGPKEWESRQKPLGPKEWESRQKPSSDMRGGDIEFGFDKRIPSAKVANINGGGGGNVMRPPHYNGGHMRPEVRFAENV